MQDDSKNTTRRDPEAHRRGTLLTRRFPALASRDFRLLWLGQVISISGSQMQNVAIAYEIYQRTGSKAMLGMVGLARIVPIVIFALVGGVIADSYRRRTIMMVTQATMMAAAVCLALLNEVGSSSALLILLLTSVTAAAGAFDGPARQALMPSLVPPQHFANAVSLSTMVFQTSMIVGPAVGGLILKHSAISMVYWTNAGTFLAVIGALFLMRPVERVEKSGRPGLQALLDGLRFVRESRIVWSTMLLDFFATFFATATALLPVFAVDVLHVDAGGLGLLYAAEAVGSLIAGIALSLIGDFGRKGKVLLLSVALYGAATAIFGLSENFYLSLLMLGFVGAGDAVSTVIRQTIRQLSTPDHIRGRMTSINMIFFMGGPQLGNLEAGLVAAAVGAPLAVVTGGVAVVLLVGWTAIRYPILRHHDR